MKISVEISMYPLDPEYGSFILHFIDRLKNHRQLQLQTNSMSTRIFGEYDEVMTALTQEMKVSFEEDKAIVTVMKVVNLDLS